jgi:hypothetical protein
MRPDHSPRGDDYKFFDSSYSAYQFGAPMCNCTPTQSCAPTAKTTIEMRFGPAYRRIRERSPTRNCPPSGFSFRPAWTSRSTKVGSSIHRVRLASGFLLVAQSKATRRGGSSYNPGPHSAASFPIGH